MGASVSYDTFLDFLENLYEIKECLCYTPGVGMHTFRFSFCVSPFLSNYKGLADDT